MNPILRFRPFLERLEPYTPGEQPSDADVLKLNTNENPYPPPDAVRDAVCKAAGRLHLYPNPTSEPLRNRLASYHNLDREQVLVGNGSDEILKLLVQAFIGPDRRLGMVDPSYSLYPVLARIFEGDVNLYPLEDRQRLGVDFYQSTEPIVFLPNPNPPLGTLYSLEEIARLCETRPDRLVVIDEAYVDFAPRDAVPLLDSHSNLAISRTFSKSFSLAGMRIGYLLAHADLVAQLMKLKDSYNLDHLAQVAGVAAIDAVDYMQANADEIKRTRDRFVDELRSIGYTVPESHANFVFAVHAEARRHFEMLRERNILVRYFDHEGLRDGMRITIGRPEQMERVLEALKEIV